MSHSRNQSSEDFVVSSAERCRVTFYPSLVTRHTSLPRLHEDKYRSEVRFSRNGLSS